jgi:hypothetical protein
LLQLAEFDEDMELLSEEEEEEWHEEEEEEAFDPDRELLGDEAPKPKPKPKRPPQPRKPREPKPKPQPPPMQLEQVPWDLMAGNGSTFAGEVSLAPTAPAVPVGGIKLKLVVPQAAAPAAPVRQPSRERSFFFFFFFFSRFVFQ